MRKLISILLLLPLSATAQLKVAPIFSDNMVLQRDEPLRIWGTGTPGREVFVSFGEEKRSDVPGTDSTWRVEFKKQTASGKPREIIVQSGTEQIGLKNLLIGDIWLCIGQSNMEWPLNREKHFHEAMTTEQLPLLRFYNPTYAGKGIFGRQFHDSTIQRLISKDFYQGQWESTGTSSIKNLTAVGYYFAREIIRHEKIPIGIIHLAIGGAPIETFIDRATLLASRRFSAKAKGNWLTNDALPVWMRQRGQQNIGNHTNVHGDDLGPNHAYKPGFAFTSGIKPITPLPIKGILWYQGESNAQEIESVNEYGALLALMVEDYRKKWNNPRLPFYFVQLSSIDTITYKGHFWPVFREEQRKVLDAILYSGMAVCSDIGVKNNVHPTNKKTVGERLARWALNKTYHKKEIIPSGPLPYKAKYRKGNVVVAFRYAEDGLKTEGNNILKGFSIDGKNQTRAMLQGKTVIIPVSEKPDFIYYGWEPFTDANLVNSVNLPASTFKIKVQ